jgi:hypothetical protein
VLGGVYKRVAPKRVAPKRVRQWGKRYSQCIYCRGDVPVEGQATRGVCITCADRASELLTVWDRTRGDTPDTLPPNLRKYSLQG